jgi:succinoglycan biosynthesis transport protein ExoP
VVVAVAAALAYSKIETPKYQSTALIQINSVGQTGQTSAPVTLPDPVQELGSTTVQLGAAKILSNPDVAGVASEVTGTVEPNTGALTITATASSPHQAQAVSQAYSQAFVNQTGAFVQTQITKINGLLAGLTAKIAALQQQQGNPPNALISTQIAALTQTYSTLQSEQYNIQAGEPYASIQVAASVPGSPTGLSKSKLIAIGLLTGLLVGTGIALLRDQFDTRVRRNPEGEDASEAPILAELPLDSDVRSGKVAIAMVQAPQSLMAEAIRELRTSVRVILGDAPCPFVLVTSPEPGDGKTFVTANLAAAWAMSGSKVIVVSADFRRPRLEEIFGLQATGLPGLADLIKANWKTPEVDTRPSAPREERGSAKADGRLPARGAAPAPSRTGRGVSLSRDDLSVSSLLVETGILGLQLLPAGIALDNPSELLGSPGMKPVVDQLPLLADVVLFDTPPVLSVPDTAILGSMTMGAIVVASEGRTDRGDLERTIRRLETTNCRVLGLALNRVRRSSSDTYQSYNYRQ